MQVTNSFAKVIAIDGPSGSGKSTVAKELARALNVIYIDTGAMYRALAYVADRDGIEFVDGPELENYLRKLDVKYSLAPDNLIEVNGENLTKKIREHHVSKLASHISQQTVVRDYLLNLQRKLAMEKVCVMEGRDIGTVVFPDAFCKFFITASVEIRAERRVQQLRESGDELVTLEQVIHDVKKRDHTDMNRPVAPLKKAEDAMLIETDEKDLADTVSGLKRIVLDRAKSLDLAIF
jgi:cytidylate kinase